MLKIYNSLTKEKEIFEPIQTGKIGIYVCGMTVYDYCHLGHARVMVSFDVITRYLRAQGYDVNYICNITDIDDKIIKRANENNEEFSELTERFIHALKEDRDALYVLPPDAEPRATEHIGEIIHIIQVLLDKDIAYVAENGDVYCDIMKHKNYGQLSHKDIAGLEAGARIEVAEVKRNPLDFVLWKMSKPNEPKWDSPWGEGRPGWHIECSAMSTKCLGDTFDIHGGGFDLQFPHHENEIAQTEGATGKRFVNTWMHVGFLQINREKMSKSLGNFFTIREVLEKYQPEVIRYFLLSSHYRSQLNYSTDNLDSAQQALERFYTSLRGLPEAKEENHSHYEERFNLVMDDDFNTPEALAVLFEITHEINRYKTEDVNRAASAATVLKRLGHILGIMQQEPEEFLQSGVAENEKIEALIADRNAARQNKDWAASDKIRDDLHAMGIELEDSPDGTIWRKL